MAHPSQRRGAFGKSARTSVSISGNKVPPLPHEADESANSTATRNDPTVEQAYTDVKRGLVDTDKGPVMHGTYERLRNKPGKGG